MELVWGKIVQFICIEIKLLIAWDKKNLIYTLFLLH